MVSSQNQVTSTPSPNVAAAPAVSAQKHAFGFRDLLSAMNPLQYLPVVGTLYRAATGDVIPESLRYIGSALVSGLIGGPIGLATNVIITVAEKVTKIDPEKIIAAQFNSTPTAVAKHEAPAAAPAVPATPVTEPPLVAFSQEQLKAYGVRANRSGTLQSGDVEGADALNSMELSRLHKAAAAYAANQSMPLTSTARRS